MFKEGSDRHRFPPLVFRSHACHVFKVRTAGTYKKGKKEQTADFTNRKLLCKWMSNALKSELNAYHLLQKYIIYISLSHFVLLQYQTSMFFVFFTIILNDIPTQISSGIWSMIIFLWWSEQFGRHLFWAPFNLKLHEHFYFL